MIDRKFKKAIKACETFLKASSGVNTFLVNILQCLKSGNIKKAQNRILKASGFLNSADYEEFKNDILNFKGDAVFDSSDFVNKWVDKFVEYFKK